MIKGEFLLKRLVQINVQDCFIKICIFLLNSKQSIINFSFLYIYNILNQSQIFTNLLFKIFLILLNDKNELGDPILRSEFETALKELKNNRASGIDNIQAEILKNPGEKALDRLFKLIGKIYKFGIIPKDFQKNKIVTLPKKTDADKCENFKPISLTSHASKILIE